MCDVMDQVEINLQKKYQETMAKIYEKKNTPVGAVPTKDDRDGENRPNRPHSGHDDRRSKN